MPTLSLKPPAQALNEYLATTARGNHHVTTRSADRAHLRRYGTAHAAMQDAADFPSHLERRGVIGERRGRPAQHRTNVI